MNTWHPYFKTRNKEVQSQAETDGTAYGYYLVRESDDKHFFISKSICVESLEKIADEVLSDNNFDYWIDKSLGEDIDSNPAWVNVDFTDKFI
jgi:hypothetical protein